MYAMSRAMSEAFLELLPLGPLGYDFFPHSPTTRPSPERTAGKAFLLSDRVSLSSAEARVEGRKGGSVGVGEGTPTGVHAHCGTVQAETKNDIKSNRIMWCGELRLSRVSIQSTFSPLVCICSTRGESRAASGGVQGRA
jgi:hypothetical protein